MAVLCGIVYGVWVGFAFTTVGTLLGEVGNFFVFRYFLPSTAGTFERKSLTCACLAHICRHGGFFIVLATRMSAIPRRLTTAVFFSTVGMGFWTFLLAAVFSLLKCLNVVYLGVALSHTYRMAWANRQWSSGLLSSVWSLLLTLLLSVSGTA